MTRRRPHPHAAITLVEATRAIYIDCEGFVDRSPTLLGVLVDEQLEQIVLDPALGAVAAARGHRLSTFETEAQSLVARAHAESRSIVAYSQHERDLLLTYAGQDVSALYRDARLIARRWRGALYPERRADGRGLKDFLKFIGYPRGDYLGDRKSTRRIRAVLDMVGKKGTYEALTATTKGQWTKLLTHNEIDCRGMQALVIRAARELEARRSASPPACERQPGSTTPGG